jgi:hypothetical protein
MFTILLGTLLIVIGLVSKADFYRSHGPGLGKYGPPIEPRWLPRLLLIVAGTVLVLDGISKIRHR